MNRLRGVDFQLRSSTFTKNLYRLWDRIPSMKTPGKEKSGRRAPAKLRAGSLVTVSENKRTADRSLVQTIWEIVAMNKAHVVLRFHAGNRQLIRSLLRRSFLSMSTISTGRTIWRQRLRRPPSSRPRRSFGFAIAEAVSVGDPPSFC
jgi:hypothetical protein